MRSLIVCALLAVSVALAQVSSTNFNGNVWYDANDYILLCGKCNRYRYASSTSTNTWYQLDCDATMGSNVIGKMKAGCNSDCTTCTQTDVSVEVGKRVLADFGLFSDSTIWSNTSSFAAIAASVQCCGRMVKTEEFEGTTCSGTSRGSTYVPAGCELISSLSSSTTYSRYNCVGSAAEAWFSCSDSTTGKKPLDACSSSTGCTGLAIQNSPCAKYEVSGFTISLSSDQTMTCTEDGTQRCLRIVRGNDYDAAVDYPSGAIGTLDCQPLPSGSAAASALVAVVAALALLF